MNHKTIILHLVIGDEKGIYGLNSKYVMIEMAENVNVEDFPCGFEGYLFNNYAASATTSGNTPNINTGIAPEKIYKQSL